ncbi:metalloregulator ArsR/SmtB family transcription factor [Cryobacterium sp. HLT2-28]|uniref:helix-turn-helix transcriptional regulator n=1 Tax=Cryobacterium sp. HLT2-28 TaxID=1259146 RepID=UPI00106D8BF2|nr:helix-turn-helix domain-containing protein [Cryobacterium sp. HLT2-28]TFB94091.1 winged helix-turn-helix transcriptional regulator [Cryobacterium sp. HLT2-28]
MPTDVIDPRSHAVLSGISRVAVLEVLRASSEPLTADAIAARVGLHPNTVRSHLDRLTEAGFATGAAEALGKPGRPRLLFRAAPSPEDAPEDSYRVLAGILAEGMAAGATGAQVTGDRSAALSGADAAALAGSRWGRRLATARNEADTTAPADAAAPSGGRADALARVVAILDEVGFSPVLGGPDHGAPTGTASLADDAPVVIELHRCPFIDVARSQADIVCSVHRGLIQGALERLDAPFGRVTLEPFARPGICLARLEPEPPDASLSAGHVE